MATDYKRRRRAKKKTAGGGHGFATGLICGLAVAALVHLYHSGRNAPAAAPERVAAPATAEAGPEAAVENRFEFYDILPEFELPVETEPTDSAGGPRPASPVPATLPPGSYYLQAGSFRQHADADRRKASLALLGISSAIQRVTIDGNQTRFRVRVGPIYEAAQLNVLRSQLDAAEIQNFTVRAVEAP